TLAAFEAPSGPGVRVDSFAYAGYTTNPNFDSLLAKLIVHSGSPDFADAVRKLYRALCEFRIEGVATNLAFLQSLVRHPKFVAGTTNTSFVEEHLAELVNANVAAHPRLFFQPATTARSVQSKGAGAKLHGADPLAVLAYGKTGEISGPNSALAAKALPSDRQDDRQAQGPAGTLPISAPMQGTIVSIDVKEGELIHKGRQVAVMEAMKMEHVIHAHLSGVIRRVEVVRGDAVFEGHALAFLEEAEVEGEQASESQAMDLH